MLVLAIFILIIIVALSVIKISSIILIRITSIILLISSILRLNRNYVGNINNGFDIFNNLFSVSSLTISVDSFIIVIGALILIPWSPLNIRNKLVLQSGKIYTAYPTISEYSLIILFTITGASFLISSIDLISMYLSLELQSFAIYILATLYRDSETSTRAGLKYFLLGGLSSVLIILGAALIYAFTGITNLNSIYSLLSVSRSYDNLLIDLGPCIIGFLIILIGYLFKVSRAPFHNWAPDVYDGVPSIITTWLTIIPKISILIFLLSLQTGLGDSLTMMLYGVPVNLWKNILLISSLLSLIIGTVVGLAQIRIKRLLAYSTISHVGFLLLALGINNEDSIDRFLFYLFQYTLTNLNSFLIILALGYIINISLSHKIFSTDLQYLSDLKGLIKINPLLTFCFIISLFSIRGVPPMIGFFGKQIVLYRSMDSGYYFISIVAIIVSVISASYYLKIVKIISFENPNTNIESPIRNWNRIPIISSIHRFTVSVLTLIILLYIIYPNIILNSISLLTLTLFTS